MVEDDLRRLLEGVRRRPQIIALTQAQSQEASLESVGSVGLRLAYQLERTLDAQVVVVAVDTSGVRVIGVSGRGDRRLLDSFLPPESELARVAEGSLESLVSTGDPLGGVVPDRRNRPGSVLLLPMKRDHAAGRRRGDLAHRRAGAGRRGPSGAAWRRSTTPRRGSPERCWPTSRSGPRR